MPVEFIAFVLMRWAMCCDR